MTYVLRHEPEIDESFVLLSVTFVHFGTDVKPDCNSFAIIGTKESLGVC